MKKQIKTTEDGTNKQRTNLIEPIKERQTKWRRKKKYRKKYLDNE